MTYRTPQAVSPPDLMSVAEVAVYLGVTERSIYAWAAEKRLPAYKAGKFIRFRRGDVEAFLTPYGT